MVARSVVCPVACLNRRQSNREDDVIHEGAAREIIDGLAQSLQHRADRHDVGTALHRFIGGVAGVQVGKDKDGRLPGHRAVRRFLPSHIGH